MNIEEQIARALTNQKGLSKKDTTMFMVAETSIKLRQR